MTDIEQGFTSMSGKINAPEDGVVYLSIPNMTGWTCYVDGVETAPKDIVGGVWLPVTKGEHTIKLSYTPPGAWLGIAGTGATALILIIVALWFRRRKKNC